MGREKSNWKFACITLIALLIPSLLGIEAFGATQNHNVTEQEQNITLPMPENTTISTMPENVTWLENITELNETQPADITTDITAPMITIPSPINVTYNTTSISLNYTIDEPVDWVGYSLNGADNVTIFMGNTTFNASVGLNHLVIYATDIAGNIGKARVQFTVDVNITPENITTVTELLNITPKLTLKLIKGKDCFALDEEPEFIFEYEYTREEKMVGIAAEAANETIEAFVYDSSGKLTDIEPEIEQISEGKFSIKLPKERAFRAGLYKLGVELVKDERVYVEEKEFPWGLVSLNTRKSIYKPGETAEFIIVVLDKEGHSVCDADISMTVTNPNDESTFYCTCAGTIVPGEECGLYIANYTTEVEGNHTINVTAQTLEKFDQQTFNKSLTKNASQVSFETNFSVQREYEFEIIREAQSKIDPTRQERFDVKIDIESFIETGADFVTVKEFVPAVFEITTTDATTLLIEEDTRAIIWTKKLVDGKTSVNYSYSVPHVWPYLYALGPVELEYTERTFVEARPWYVAVDPITVINVQSYPTVGGNWTVMFTTTGKADLTITTVDGTTWSNVNEANDSKFLEVRCGEEVLDYEWIDGSVFIENYECNETGYEVSKVLTSGKHTLEFRFGDDVKYAYNQAGDNYFYNESEGVSSTTSTSYINKTILTFTLSSAGNYTILATAELNGSVTTADVLAQLVIDGTTYAVYSAQPDELNFYSEHFATHRTMQLSSGTHTIIIQYAAESGQTTYIRRARIAAVRVTDQQFSETDAQQSLSTSYANIATLTFSVGTTGEYLIIGSAEYQPASTSYSVYAQVTVDGTSIGEALFEGETTTDYEQYFTANITNLTAGSHTIALQGRSESGTMYMRRARVSAIPISGNFQYSCIAADESETAGTTTVTNKTVLTFTPPSQANYLILSMGIVGGSASNGAIYHSFTDTQIDGTQMGYTENVFSDATDKITFARIKNVSLSASSYDVYVRYWEGSSGAVTLKNTRIIALTPSVGPNVDQIHYRWRNDSYGLNTNNGWYAAEDTAYESLAKQTTLRLRVEIANIGSSSAENYQYQIEYSNSTAGPWTAVPVTATTEPFEMVDSTQYADGDNVISGFLTATGTWANGKGVENPSNKTGNFSLTNAYYTEFEYAIQATTNATAGGTYYFRLTNAGSTTNFTYTRYPEVTVYLAPNVTQIHYRWRNDDGAEGNKTFSATTGDGYVQASSATYSTAHDASTGTVHNTEDEIRVGQQLTGGTYYIDRSTLFFDTSAIPDDAVISNATLTLYVSGDYSNTDFDIQIQRPRLTLSEKATTTVTNVYQIHGQDYDGSQYIYWSARGQTADSLTKMNKDTISSYTTYEPTGHTDLTFRDDYVLYCTANSKVYVVAQDAGNLNYMTLYEFNPTTSSYVEKITFGTDASIPGGLVYAFGYLWTGSRGSNMYRVNLSDFTYSTLNNAVLANLHWLGANSNYIWGTTVEASSDVIKVDPNTFTISNSWLSGVQITDDNYVDDSKVYCNIEAATTGIRVFDISSETFTTYTSSGASTGYGLWRWNFTNIYNETEDWLVACYGGSDHLIWYEKSTVAEIRRVNTYTDFTTQLDSPNDIQVIGDYLYVTSWTANPTRICKYRLDTPEITAPLEAADYNKDLYRKNGGTFNTSGISGTGIIEISLNTTGINWINKTGTTTLNLRSSRDINSNTPTGNEYITFYSANKGSGYEPVLAVTYQNAATWKAAEDTNITVQKKNENIRVRFSVQNTGGKAFNYNYRLQVAAKGAAACCEEVASANFADVTTVTGGCGSSVACMNNSTYFVDQDPTTRQLSIPDSLPFTAGKMVEDPSNQTNAFTLNKNRFTEFEYNFYFTNNASSGTTYCFRLANAGVPLDNYTKVATVTLETYLATLQIRNQTASQNVTSINVSGTSGYTVTNPYNNVDGSGSTQNITAKIPVVTIYNPSSSTNYRIWLKVTNGTGWDNVIKNETFNVTADATDPGDVSTWTSLKPGGSWDTLIDTGETVTPGTHKDLYLAFHLKGSGTGDATISVLAEES